MDNDAIKKALEEQERKRQEGQTSQDTPGMRPLTDSNALNQPNANRGITGTEQNQQATQGNSEMGSDRVIGSDSDSSATGASGSDSASTEGNQQIQAGQVPGVEPIKPEDKKRSKEDVTLGINAGAEVLGNEDELSTLEKGMGEVLKEYNNLESEIPITHDYWNVRNRVLAMRNDARNKSANKSRMTGGA